MNTDWCRSEECQYRNWRSGGIPTHRRGNGCPPLAEESTPPADDVREALADVIEGVGVYVPGSHGHDWINPNKAADAILAAFEVRPRGTVTDADAPDISGFEGTRAAVDGLSIRGGEPS